MAKKLFERETVLDNAISLFWQHGYTASSIQLITQFTGLKPGSLYNEFGNKEGLFRAALERYSSKSVSELHLAFENQNDVRLAIINILQSFVNASKKEHYCGCFIIKTQLELAAQENLLYQLACDKLMETESVYQHYLMKLYSQDIATQYAQQLMMTIFGLRVYGYQKHKADNLQKAVIALLPWLKNETETFA